MDMTVFKVAAVLLTGIPFCLGLMFLWEVNNKRRFLRQGRKMSAVIERVTLRGSGRITLRKATIKTESGEYTTMFVPVWYFQGRQIEIHKLNGGFRIVSKYTLLTEVVVALFFFYLSFEFWATFSALNAIAPS